MATRNFKISMAAKRHVVRALARRTRHAKIVEELHEKFGLTVHVRAIGHYNPKTNPRLDDELKLLYEQMKVAHFIELQIETEMWLAARREERASEREERLREERLREQTEALRAKTKSALLAEAQGVK